MTAPARSSWHDVEAVFDGIWDRRYYTNHGPLVRTLEAWLEEHHRVTHAVTVTNPAIGLLMMLENLQPGSSVMLSALADRTVIGALDWVGLKPIFCDVDRDSPAFCPDLVEWGGNALLIDPSLDCPGDPSLGRALVEEADRRGTAVLLTAPRSGLAYPALLKLTVSGEGPPAACILTDDTDYACRLRNIRSSYGSGPPVPVRRTANGRLSEAQAGLALLYLQRGHSPVEDPKLDQRFSDCRFAPYQEMIALTLPDLQQRDRALACLSSSGYRVRKPVSLDRRALHCANAVSFIECSLLLQPEILGRLPELAKTLKDVCMLGDC